MSTAIQWCHLPGYAADVWNPTTGCTSNGTGCDLCYARTLTNMRHKAYKAGKLQNMPHYAHPFNVVQQHPGRLANPMKVKRPTCYFVNSMSDLFHEEVPFSFVDQVFAVMAMCPQHIFIILTKRAERMAEYTNDGTLMTRIERICADMKAADRRSSYPSALSAFPLPNVWMGASASTQAEVDAAVPHVLKTNAAKRILSLEPLVGAVRIAGYLSVSAPRVDRTANAPRAGSTLDWVIVGGESGTTKQKPRPMHPDWARQVRDECKAAGVPFFFKQWGAWLPIEEPWVKDSFRSLSPNERWLNREGGQGFHGEHVWRMRRASKHANGHLLDGKEEFAWPISPAKAGVPHNTEVSHAE